MLIPRDICYTRQETSDEVHQREYSTLVRASCPLNPQKKSASTAQTATNVSRIAHNRSMSSSNVTQALIGGCPFEWAQTQLSVRVRVAGRARFKWRRCLALTQGRPIPSARRNCGGVRLPTPLHATIYRVIAVRSFRTRARCNHRFALKTSVHSVHQARFGESGGTVSVPSQREDG
jgi:hypothetical protein